MHRLEKSERHIWLYRYRELFLKYVHKIACHNNSYTTETKPTNMVITHAEAVGHVRHNLCEISERYAEMVVRRYTKIFDFLKIKLEESFIPRLNEASIQELTNLCQLLCEAVDRFKQP